MSKVRVDAGTELWYRGEVINCTDAGHCEGFRQDIASRIDFLVKANLKSAWVNRLGRQWHVASSQFSSARPSHWAGSVSIRHFFPWCGPPQSLSHASIGMSTHSLVLHGMNMVRPSSRPPSPSPLTRRNRQSPGTVGFTGSLRNSTQSWTGQIFGGTSLYVIANRSYHFRLPGLRGS